MMIPLPFTHLPWMQIGVAALAAFALGVLYRWASALRRDILALELEHGLMKKRFEAATGGLHVRLLQVERRLRPIAAAVSLQTGVSAADLRASAGAGEARILPPLGAKNQLSRGEMELLKKIRQLASHS